jgi:hypothetical protein
MSFSKDYTNFEAYICSAYDGELPTACRGKHLAIAQHTKASRGDKVCPVSTTVEHILFFFKEVLHFCWHTLSALSWVVSIKRYFGAIPNRLAMVSYIYRVRVQVTGEFDVDSHTYNDRSPNTITTTFNTPPQS